MFTTPDYFPLLTRQFHRETQWNENNLYSTFCRTSQSLLDFPVPLGVSVSTGRGVSNSLHSQFVFSMIPSRASSIGYLATSRPLLVISPETITAVEEMQPAAMADVSAKKSKKTRKRKTEAQNKETLLTGFLPSEPKSSEQSSGLAERPLDFATARQQAIDSRDARNLLQSIRAGTWKYNWDLCASQPASNPQTYTGDYMISAQMYPSVSSVTGTWITRRSQFSELQMSGVSRAGMHSDLQLVVQHTVNKPKWSRELTFGTLGALLGARGLYNFGDIPMLNRATQMFYRGTDTEARQVLLNKVHGRLAVGGEVYFGAQDSSAGISLGARYRHDLPLFSEVTCVVNPIMGHVSVAWAQALRPRLCCAARYEFNLFSITSDLAMGVEWQLDDNSIVKARWSDSQGLKCLVDARMNNMVFSMGLTFNKDYKAERAADVARLIKSFGLQFQWFI
ncbi:Mitochondrial distribution and morphology protein 10 [Linderina macrospora]|uniref:Mitochondrial distribution and morphology protein 10 n=1 Tax=Linderina macrospora TaxID=4868 RepID=A0ACC1J7W3_9FUNG|nr:Mitochondrial distribution and morphology protein 10 [Linderina macrospora]